MGLEPAGPINGQMSNSCEPGAAPPSGSTASRSTRHQSRSHWRREEARHVNVEGRAVDENPRYQRHDVFRLVVEITGLDDSEAREQSLALDLRQTIDAGLLHQIVVD